MNHNSTEILMGSTQTKVSEVSEDYSNNHLLLDTQIIDGKSWIRHFF